ncbi:MAG: hypothetical protein Q4E73_01415, partial [Lachnospiraceae bacterium]|nr:hypothetical protein [Lachnospiraceae bacterium]
LKMSKESFCEIKDENEKEFLQNLAFITTLSFDIYMKKQIIEGMIDSLYTPEDEKTDKKKKKK